MALHHSGHIASSYDHSWADSSNQNKVGQSELGQTRGHGFHVTAGCLSRQNKTSSAASDLLTCKPLCRPKHMWNSDRFPPHCAADQRVMRRAMSPPLQRMG